MAFYTISPAGNDSTGQPNSDINQYETFSKVLTLAGNGDTIYVRGTITGQVIDISNNYSVSAHLKIKEHVDGGLIDGQWTHPTGTAFKTGPDGDFVYTPLVGISGRFIDWHVPITRSRGRGIGITGPDNLVEGLGASPIQISWSRNANLHISGTQNIIIRNILSMYSGSYYQGIRDPSVYNWAVSTNCLDSTNVLFDRIVSWRNWGEGFAAGRGTTYLTLQDSILADNLSLNAYMNGAHHVWFLRNLIFCTGGGIDYDRGGGVVIRNEPNTADFFPGHDLWVAHNLLVGNRHNIQIASNQVPGHSIYNVYVYNNTLINAVRPNPSSTYSGFNLASGDRNNLFIDSNVCVQTDGAFTLGTNFSEYDFERGYWQGAGSPPAGVLSATDFSSVTIPNPNAAYTVVTSGNSYGQAYWAGHTINPENYRPVETKSTPAKSDVGTTDFNRDTRVYWTVGAEEGGTPTGGGVPATANVQATSNTLATTLAVTRPLSATIGVASETSEIQTLDIYIPGAFEATVLAQSDTRRARLSVEADIVVANSAAITATAATPSITLPFTVPVNDNRALYVIGCEWRTNETPNALQATFNGVGLTALVSATTTTLSRFYNCTIFRMIAPPEILADIVLSTTDASNMNDVVLFGAALVNVNQVTPGTSVATSLAGPWSAGFTTANAGSVLLGGVMAYGGDVTFSPGGAAEIINQQNTGTSTTADISAALLKLVAGMVGSYALAVSGDNDTKGVEAVVEVIRAPVESLKNFIGHSLPASLSALVDMAVRRDLVAGINAGSMTASVDFAASVNFAAGAAVASNTGIAPLLVRHDLAVTIGASTTTGSVNLVRAIELNATALTQSAGADASLAVIRTMSSQIAAVSDTAVAGIALATRLTATATVASDAGPASLALLVALSVSAQGVSTTSSVNLGVFSGIVLSALMQPVCVSVGGDLAVERRLSSAMLAGSATPAVGLMQKLPFDSSSLAVSTTPVSGLAIMRSLQATALGQSDTSSALIILAIVLSGSSSPATMIGEPNLSVDRALVGNVVANCATTTPTLQVLRNLVAVVGVESGTSIPYWLSFIYFAATAQVSSAAGSPLFKLLAMHNVKQITASALFPLIAATGSAPTITARTYRPWLTASKK